MRLEFRTSEIVVKVGFNRNSQLWYWNMQNVAVPDASIPAREPSLLGSGNAVSLSPSALGGSGDQVLKTKCIMIVDDENVNIMTLKAFLSREGYRNFVTTTDPRDAIEMIRQENPDVLM